MAATEDALEQIETDEPADEDAWVEGPVSELVEQAGRDAGTLAVREVELAAARRTPAIRQVGRDLALAIVAAAAFVTAFALANWAAVVALSKVLPDWLAPLVVAAAWAGVGVLLLVALRHRVRGIGSAWGGDPEEVVRERERAREEAEATLRDTLDRLAEAVAAEAEDRIREAVVPSADGVVDAGEDILDVADDFTDSIGEAVPGGGLVNGVLDLALLPGRVSVRVARAALGRDGDAEDRNDHDSSEARPGE